MAETNALLKRHTGNCIEGSNPSVSASRASPTASLSAFHPLRTFALEMGGKWTLGVELLIVLLRLITPLGSKARRD